MKVLFLSVSIGTGHMRAAEAIKEAIEVKYPKSEMLIVDTLKYINPIIDKLVVGSYLNTLKNTPKLYQKLYEMSDSGDNMNDISGTLNRLLSFRINKLVKNFEPSIIVCTHPFPLQMISNLKKKGKISVPIISILTDFVVHSFWLQSHIDAYVVAHDFMKYEMIKKGIPSHLIYPYGIPVSRKFTKRLKSKETLLKEYKLEDVPTFLIMGGGLGFGEIKSYFLSLLNHPKNLQIIAVTGKNLKLKKELEECSLNSSKKVKVLSFTKRIAELMAISDFIITKPGGMTISESLIKRLPILIISPIPGQEEKNAHFLLNNGLAARLFESDDMDDILFQFENNPLRVKQMKEMTKIFAKPNSSKDILNLLENLINKI